MNISLAIAKAMDKLTLLSELERAIQRYKQNPCKEQEAPVLILCHFYMHKLAGEHVGYENADKQMSEIELASKLIRGQTDVKKN